MKMNIKKDLGNSGEQIAVEYLEKIGFKILNRNFYCKQGEIDIVARDGDEVVFIEVKTRTNTNFGNPSEAVDYRKQKHIYKSAKYFLCKYKMLDAHIRFDVVEVLVKDGRFNVNHIKQII